MSSGRSIPLAFYPARMGLLDFALVGSYALFAWAAKGSFPILAAGTAAVLAATGVLVQLLSRRLLAILGFAAVSMVVASASMLLIGLAVIAMLQLPSRSSAVVAVAGFIVVALLAGTGVTLRRGTDAGDFLSSVGKLNQRTGGFDPRFPSANVEAQQRAEHIGAVFSFLTPLLVGVGIGFGSHLPVAVALAVIAGCTLGPAGLYAFGLGTYCGLVYRVAQWERRNGKTIQVVGR